jgi:hypothetical protein
LIHPLAGFTSAPTIVEYMLFPEICYYSETIIKHFRSASSSWRRAEGYRLSHDRSLIQIEAIRDKLRTISNQKSSQGPAWIYCLPWDDYLNSCLCFAHWQRPTRIPTLWRQKSEISSYDSAKSGSENSWKDPFQHHEFADNWIQSNISNLTANSPRFNLRFWRSVLEALSNLCRWSHPRHGDPRGNRTTENRIEKDLGGIWVVSDVTKTKNQGKSGELVESIATSEDECFPDRFWQFVWTRKKWSISHEMKGDRVILRNPANMIWIHRRMEKAREKRNAKRIVLIFPWKPFSSKLRRTRIQGDVIAARMSAIRALASLGRAFWLECNIHGSQHKIERCK